MPFERGKWRTSLRAQRCNPAGISLPSAPAMTIRRPAPSRRAKSSWRGPSLATQSTIRKCGWSKANGGRSIRAAPPWRRWATSISTPMGGGWSEDFSKEPLGRQGFFIHEMTHVWQSQSKGPFYLPLMRHPFCRYGYRAEAGQAVRALWPRAAGGNRQSPLSRGPRRSAGRRAAEDACFRSAVR